MRRSATRLSLFLMVLMLVPGCGLFGKKKADTMAADTGSDPYASPVYDEPVGDYDPYETRTTRATTEPAGTAFGSPVMASQAAPTMSGSRYHTVTKGDTLYAIARMYYGDQRRWKDVYEANRSALPDPNMIKTGQQLVIP